MISRRNFSCQGQGASRCDWGVFLGPAGRLSDVACGSAESPRSAWRWTWATGPHSSRQTPISMQAPRYGTQKLQTSSKIMFFVISLPPTLVPVFPTRAERRMEPGRPQTIQSATCPSSRPRVVGFNIRSHHHALRCNAEGACARHGSSAAARSALVISAHGNEVYDCCWVDASGLATSRTTAAHCRLSGHHSARAGRYGLRRSHAAAARDTTSPTAWRATGASAEVERAVGASVGGGGEQWV